MNSSQLLRGTLHVLILEIVSGGAQHGYAIATRIEALSEGRLRIEDGALYQALHRMQQRGWLDSRWGHADSGKRARFYELTGDGRKQLRTETAAWNHYVEAVGRVLRPRRSPGR